MFDFAKKLFRVVKNKDEINELLQDMRIALNMWKTSEYTTFQGTISVITSNSMEIFVMSYFPYTNEHNYNEAKILLAFWYLYYYIKVLEDNNLLEGQSREDVFNSLYNSVANDLYEHPSKVKFSRSKKYYTEKLEIYFKYHNFHDIRTSMIGLEMSQNVVNLLNSNDEDYRRKVSDVNTIFNLVLPEFEKKILHK